jgi:hypothetical protein
LRERQIVEDTGKIFHAAINMSARQTYAHFDPSALRTVVPVKQ